MRRYRLIHGVVAAFAIGTGSMSEATASPAHGSTGRDTKSAQERPSADPRSEATELKIRVTKLVMLTTSDARGVITVPRDSDNRILRVILESDGYYSCSDIQLDGDAAPLTHTVEWKSVPPGSYVVFVEVHGSTGLRRSIRVGAVEAPASSAGS